MKISGDIKKMQQTLGKLEENYAKLRNDFLEHTATSFSIETSQYKVCNMGQKESG